MSELKLLPCPFCGGEASIVKSWRTKSKEISVSCNTDDCLGRNEEQGEQGGYSASFYSDAEAIEAWNTRVAVSDGMALVPRNLPNEILGKAAIAGVFETGNPKHGWDFILAELAKAEPK